VLAIVPAVIVSEFVVDTEDTELIVALGVVPIVRVAIGDIEYWVAMLVTDPGVPPNVNTEPLSTFDIVILFVAATD
jgi:hypothetical protein